MNTVHLPKATKKVQDELYLLLTAKSPKVPNIHLIQQDNERRSLPIG